VGKYSLFTGSEVSFEVSELNGNLVVSMFGVKSELQKISPTHYKFKGGNEVKFDYSREGIYDRFATINEGRPQWFIREDSLLRSRTRVTDQAVYTQRLVRNLKPGGYTYSRFLSPSRGLVDYSVYLPPEWKRNSSKTYPLMFFLHGQLGWERSFPDSVPATQLNQWIAKGYIPPMVIVSLRTGRLNGNVEEQWSSARNESLLTSEQPNELRQFIRQQFRAGMSAKTTAIHGHSRGSRGAIHYALKYPTSFSSAVANAFVSDYALDETKQIAQQNQLQIRNQGIPLRISIGDRDEFALNMGRKASPVIHQFLKNLNIPHDYEVFPGVNHGFVNVWNARQKSGLPNGLAELQLHAGAWARL
jgi:enterochelin esterase-like enzyme